MNKVEFLPQPGPQSALLSCPIEDVLFGGAVGGGKTYGMLLDFLSHAMACGAGAKGLFVRRVGANLDAVIKMSMRIFPHFGGVYRKRSGWTFASGPARGATLQFRHMWDIDAAILQFQGDDYSWVCVEEMGQYPKPEPIDYLKTRLRSAAGVKCVFRATANPGGAGHGWIKARYISPCKTGYKVLTDPRSGENRVFIPSRLEDNRILMESDPRYESRLKGLGPPAMVKALRFGDWDSLAGAFFSDVINLERQVIRPFAIPPTWTRRRSFDWGSAKPASLGLWAISDGTQPKDHPTFFPRGSAVRTGEWYTVATGDDGLPMPDTGLRLTNDDLGMGIAERSLNANWSGCVADPSIFTENGGPSIFAQMNEGAKKKGRALIFKGADNTRVPGWQRMRGYLEASCTADRENPGLYVFANCTDWIRTVPDIQMDKDRPDDIDTKAEDHCFTGETMVITAKGLKRIDELVGVDGQVIGRDGRWHWYTKARLTKRQSDIVEVSFSDGSSVRCTPDHKFLTIGGIWRFSRDMEGEFCYTPHLCTSLSSPKQSRNFKGLGTIFAAPIFKGRASGFIGWFSRSSTGPSRTDHTSIILTITGQIMNLATSLLCRAASIVAITPNCPAQERSASKQLKPQHLSGTGVQRGGHGMSSSSTLPFGQLWPRRSSVSAAIAASHSLQGRTSASILNFARMLASHRIGGKAALTTSRAIARFAGLHSKSIATEKPNTVPVHALPEAHGLKVVSIKPAGKADVYCMTVPTSESFTLANGAVVHNCADETRYLLQSLTAAGVAAGASKMPTKGR